MRRFGSERMDGMLQAPGPQGGRGDHPSVDQQGAGEGAAEGRGLQLRDPQAAAQVRRRDERPAQGRLRAAPRADGGRGRRRHGARHAPPGVEDLVAKHIPEKAYAEQWDIEHLHGEVQRALDLDLPLADWAKEEGIADAGDPRAADQGQRRADRRQGRAVRRADDADGREDACCCRFSTISGRSICCTSTICARASICAATPSATRSTSTSARPSTCSRRCSPTCARP